MALYQITECIRLLGHLFGRLVTPIKASPANAADTKRGLACAADTKLT